MHLVFPLTILHNQGFQFLQGITVVPREIENNGSASFGGETRCIMVYMKMVSALLVLELLTSLSNGDDGGETRD